MSSGFSMGMASLRPSRLSSLVLNLALVLALTSALFLPDWRYTLLTALLTMALYALECWYLRRTAISGIRWYRHDWAVSLPEDGWIPVALTGCWLSRYCIILYAYGLEPGEKKRTLTLVLFADAMESEVWRRLQVRLRYQSLKSDSAA
ncbi:protein YgfX [Pokkaliibacter sp. CJK22405]|uniref:protein YgfX n=1 Tax=Pokkaliibacter sp. CJK22405 TaxID=3384615 RepID=UPI0039847D99